MSSNFSLACRTLKKRSALVGNAEHDESEDEEDYDSDLSSMPDTGEVIKSEDGHQVHVTPEGVRAVGDIMIKQERTAADHSDGFKCDVKIKTEPLSNGKCDVC